MRGDVLITSRGSLFRGAFPPPPSLWLRAAIPEFIDTVGIPISAAGLSSEVAVSREARRKIGPVIYPTRRSRLAFSLTWKLSYS